MNKTQFKIRIKRALFCSGVFALVVATAFMCNPRSEFDYWETMEEQEGENSDTDQEDAGHADSGIDERD